MTNLAQKLPRIVTLTMNPTIDTSVDVEQVAPTHKLRCGPPRRDPGGGGINVSRAIQRLGGSSLALYTAGGHYGQLLRDLLSAAELEHHPISIHAQTRENFTAHAQSSDQEYRFVMPGPKLSAAEWRHCLDAVGELDPPPAYLVISGSLPQGVPENFYAQVVQLAHRRQIRVVVDTSGPALRAAADAGVYILKPNLRELSQLVGHDLQDETDQEAAARELITQAKSEIVLVSLGSAGALLVTADHMERIRSPTVRIASRIGAGDSTVAGFILALARGEELPAAARFGVAAGAAAVMTPGTELCRRADTERLYAQTYQEQTA